MEVMTLNIKEVADIELAAFHTDELGLSKALQTSKVFGLQTVDEIYHPSRTLQTSS